jgi:histidine phosphotransferase ChpT
MRMDAQLARLLAARLCHDLGGAVGTLGGTLDLVRDGEGEMLALAQETAGALRQRLRLYAAAWGEATPDADAAALARLLEGSPAAPRVRFQLNHLAPGAVVPGALIPLALNAALLAAEALPRGGSVTLAGSAEAGLYACPEGRDAAWPPALLALLAGADPAAVLEEGPRRVLAPLLLSLAAEAGWSVSLAHGPEQGAAAGGVPPLLLAPIPMVG